MAEEKKKGRLTLNMEERERVRIGGVMEVLSFDEDGIMMETTCGLAASKGRRDAHRQAGSGGRGRCCRREH